MRILISPAKKMRVDPDSFAPGSPPIFLEQAERLQIALQGMSKKELQALWRCSDAIAARSMEHLHKMNLRRCLTPAVLSYDGIQYRYMAPGVLETEPLTYLREHLRILSGFYGLLRPFDGVAPYRLEMQAHLQIDGCANLYAYWGDRLARQLAKETNCILNLASKEYSRAVTPHLPSGIRFVTCRFGEWRNGRLVEKGTLCKMARGQMVRWLAVHAITRPEELPLFDELGYRFSAVHSSENQLVFLKGETV